MANSTQIPKGWQSVRLGDVAEVRGGSTPSRVREEFWGGAIPWVVPSELTELTGRYLTSTKESITTMGMKSAGLKYIPSGSVLLTSRATIGVTAINTLPIVTNQGFQSLIVKNETDCLWLFYCISTMRPELEKRASGSTFREVSRDSVRSLPILLPPLPEQQAIAAVLDSIDEAIERTDAVIAATERLRDALLHQLLTRGMPGWHTEWKDAPRAGTIPADWQVVRLGDVLVLDQPGAWGDEPTPTDPGVRVLRATDLTRDGRVDSHKAVWRRLSQRDREHRLMQDGDLILERSGGGPGTPVGRVALINRLGPVYCTNFCQQLRVDSTRCSPYYAARALWHRYTSGMTARLEHRTTGIRNLDYSGYLSLPILLPPLPEQQAIAAVLDSVEDAVEKARNETDMLNSLKASAADALLTGRVRVGEKLATREL